MIRTSRKSIIGQRKRSSSGKCDPWYDDVLDIVTESNEIPGDEDVVIAIESSIFAANLHREQIEKSVNEKRESDSRHPKHVSCECNERSARVGTNHQRGASEQKSLKANGFALHKYFGWGRHDSDSENDESKDGNGLFGTEGSAPGWTLNRYFNNDSNSARQKKTIAMIAKLLSFAGLVTALFFVTRDFIASSREATSTIQYVSMPRLDLPKLWFCSADTELPMYADVPLGYYGQPLLWIDFVKGTRDNLNITFPDTKILSQVSYESIRTSGRSCNASRVMDPQIFYHENYEKPSCFHCLSMQRNPAFTIDRDINTDSLSPTFSGHASFRISQQSFLSHCRMSQYGLRLDILRFFREEIKRHSRELEARGILHFNSVDPNNGTNDGLLFPFYRYGYFNTTMDLTVFDIVDMYCNVYMFSGYFYPSKPADIRFEFDSQIYRWKRLGEGPYYPNQYSNFYGKFGLPRLWSVEQGLGQELYENRSMFMGNTLYVMTNASRIGGAETLAVLEPEEIVSVSFSRGEINGQELYETRIMRTKLEVGMTRTVNNIYFVDFRFDSFLTRFVSEQQAMSWTAFLADFFGLMSLFLDVSVYTLIVSPISGRKAPGHQKSRKRAIAKAKKAMRNGYERRG